jgi:hypothetical protein
VYDVHKLLNRSRPERRPQRLPILPAELDALLKHSRPERRPQRLPIPPAELDALLQRAWQEAARLQRLM